jgi:[acyl-carrier-protein] S-malonyltransferase
MEPARLDLEKAILETTISAPVCPIYQNFTALPSSDVAVIKENLAKQLTGPVRWTQSVQNMVADGATHFTELGPGKVLQGLVQKIYKEAVIEAAS